MGVELNNPANGEEPSKKRDAPFALGIAKLQDMWRRLNRLLSGSMRLWNSARRSAAGRDAKYLLFTCAICGPFWLVSWFFPTAIAVHWLCATAYVFIFVLTLAILLRRVLGLIRDMFSIDDGKLIKCLKRNGKIRRSIDLCENNLPAIIKQPPDQRSEEFARLVKETSLDLLAHARCTHPIRIPLAMHMIFVHLGLIALTFASANLVVQSSRVAVEKIMDNATQMPATLLERLLLYSTVSLDHMSLGNLRSFALPWQTELLLVAEVVAGLWIVLVFAPLVFSEAAAFRAMLENETRIERELTNYWCIKFGISS